MTDTTTSYRTSEHIVITGGPSSGKTSTIQMLKDRGYPCLPEAAAAHIESRLSCNETLAQICSDQRMLQQGILHVALKQEELLPPEASYFLDRTAADTLAYCKLYNLDTAYFLERIRTRYKRIFLLNRLPLEKNHVRIEDDETASRLDRLLEEVYTELGYDVTRVPVINNHTLVEENIRARVDWILSYC